MSAKKTKRKKFPLFRTIAVILFLAAIGGACSSPSDNATDTATPTTQGALPQAADEGSNASVNPARGTNTSIAPGTELDPDVATLTAHFIDVGQGDSELIELPDGKTMLIDAGTSSAASTVIDYLEEQDVDTIDYLVATHPHADHIGGMAQVIRTFEVGELWMPDASSGTATYERFLDAVEDAELTVHQAKAGESIADEDAGYEIDIAGPEEGVESEDANDASVIIQVTYEDASFVFTGDAPASAIAKADLDEADVLKAAHHGSETGTNAAVMNKLDPTYVVMSYKEGNSYGHPDQSVLDAIESAGATAYSTAANGTVTATTDGDAVLIETEKSGSITAGMSRAERERQEAKEKEEAAARKKKREEAERAAAAAQAEAEAKAESEAREYTAYITPTGEKYHLLSCRTLSRTKNPTPMSEQSALNAGYDACKVCNP